MSTPERAGLVAKIRQIRNPLTSEPAAPSPRPEHSARIQALETRVAHLEELIEGFQDSVHRESARESRRITELEERIEPSALAAALSKDARERGL
ncbi:MAG TPA: hypothetical protein VIK04_06310 [Solirubrobacteraceae bacterium]